MNFYGLDKNLVSQVSPLAKFKAIYFTFRVSDDDDKGLAAGISLQKQVKCIKVKWADAKDC